MDKNATNRIKKSLISGKTISKIRLYVCLNYIRHDMDICEKRLKKCMINKPYKMVKKTLCKMSAS